LSDGVKRRVGRARNLFRRWRIEVEMSDAGSVRAARSAAAGRYNLRDMKSNVPGSAPTFLFLALSIALIARASESFEPPPATSADGAAGPAAVAATDGTTLTAAGAATTAAASSTTTVAAATATVAATTATTVAGSVAASLDADYAVADRIVVRKSLRRLYLMQADHIITEYPIRLGLKPDGDKEREGDFRTPEGQYYLVRRNPRSDFFLSIEVSYPNDEDRRRARHSGVAPGGLIMIHGQPNVPRKGADYYARNDWTDGCIAVSNPDMVDIWLRTRVGLPIEIRP
jgi:hypothetical protein